jgi:hypothetical protein
VGGIVGPARDRTPHREGRPGEEARQDVDLQQTDLLQARGDQTLHHHQPLQLDADPVRDLHHRVLRRRHPRADQRPLRRPLHGGGVDRRRPLRLFSSCEPPPGDDRAASSGDDVRTGHDDLRALFGHLPLPPRQLRLGQLRRLLCRPLCANLRSYEHCRVHDPARSDARRAFPRQNPGPRGRSHIHDIQFCFVRRRQSFPLCEELGRGPRGFLDFRRIIPRRESLSLLDAPGDQGQDAQPDRGLLPAGQRHVGRQEEGRAGKD